VAVVAAYGLLLPPAVLEAPRLGCLNIHASLLPRWRGAAPIQYAIWKGDERSGVGIMQMEEGLDTGPVLAQRAVPIRPETTARSLHDELSALGAALVVEVLQKLAAGEKLVPTPQDDRAATYAPMLDKVDGIVDWTQTATEIGRQVRALNPWPGVWTTRLSGRRIKIIDAEPVSEQFPAAPGTVVDRHGHVACGGDTGLKLHVVQPENARPMDATAAINGLYLRVDDVLG
jgi:methionyl-tRNA formyltransferase